MPRHFIEGHAIVSAEGAIADAAGHMPSCLRVEADWMRFQRRLEGSRLVVLGRASHEVAPNPGRHRLVITSVARGLERVDALTHRLDPATGDLRQALASIVPEGGRIAVVGGTRVFGLFLELGFDRFDLTVAGRCSIEEGRPVFPGIMSIRDAFGRLAAHGLAEHRRLTLDPAAGAILYVFRRLPITHS